MSSPVSLGNEGSTPTVDVLIPVFNGEHYIEDSIASIQAQTVRSITIHVIDDGSTDGTPGLLATMAQSDTRLRVYTRPNGGIVDALNFGIKQCTAEFVARHDADDLAAPERFSWQLEILGRHPDVCATAGSARHIDAAGRDLGTRATLFPPDLCNPYAFPAREPYLLHPFLMVRRKALVEAGGYRFVLHAEDSDLYWRLKDSGRLHFDDREYGAYRMHDASISSASIQNGRALSVSSQLAALSAIRRATGRQDLCFAQAGAAVIKSHASSLDAVCKAVSDPLTADEARHLRFATAAKLLEIAGYRPFELEASDCAFFDAAYRETAGRLRGRNRSVLLRTLAGTAARLAANGRWGDAWRLCRLRNPVGFIVRLLTRIAMPSTARAYLRRMVGRS